MNLHVMCVNCIWTLTLFEQGDHFVNNILELPIWPEGRKKNIDFTSTQHTRASRFHYFCYFIYLHENRARVWILKGAEEPDKQP